MQKAYCNIHKAWKKKKLYSLGSKLKKKNLDVNAFKYEDS